MALLHNQHNDWPALEAELRHLARLIDGLQQSSVGGTIIVTAPPPPSTPASETDVLKTQIFDRHEEPIPRLKEGPNISITQRADEFEIAALPESDQNILAVEAFGKRSGLIPRLKAGSVATIMQQADEFEIDASVLAMQIFGP